VSVDSSEFSFRYPSVSRPVTSSKIFIIHSHQSVGSEMEDTALGIFFYFLFPEIIFSAEILTVHFIDLNLQCPSQVKIAPVHVWQHKQATFSCLLFCQ
jgi:hypothetical protein